jgi:hypothetical protein
VFVYLLIAITFKECEHKSGPLSLRQSNLFFCVLHRLSTPLAGEESNILMSKFPSVFVIRGWLVVCFFLVLREGNVKAIYKRNIFKKENSFNKEDFQVA